MQTIGERQRQGRRGDIYVYCLCVCVCVLGSFLSFSHLELRLSLICGSFISFDPIPGQACITRDAITYAVLLLLLLFNKMEPLCVLW